MKRNYRYEKEMLHWLDGGEIEQSFDKINWRPFDGMWLIDDGDWEYRIAETDYCQDEGCDHYSTKHVCVTPADA